MTQSGHDNSSMLHTRSLFLYMVRLVEFTECRSAFMAGDLQRYVAHTCMSRGGSGSATTR